MFNPGYGPSIFLIIISIEPLSFYFHQVNVKKGNVEVDTMPFFVVYEGVSSLSILCPCVTRIAGAVFS